MITLQTRVLAQYGTDVAELRTFGQADYQKPSVAQMKTVNLKDKIDTHKQEMAR